MEGASYYRVYHADHMTADCRLETGGVSGSCELLEDNISRTSYTDANPDQEDNYYWVVACNSTGCSDIDSDLPMRPMLMPHTVAAELTLWARVPRQLTGT